MAAPRIFVSYYFSDISFPHDKFVSHLIEDLRTAGIEVVTFSASSTNSGFLQNINQLLLTCQWLLLVQTPQAMNSSSIQLTVSTALQLVGQQKMQGILRVIALPCNLQEVPPTWGTLATYDATQDYQRALARVLLQLGVWKARNPPPFDTKLSPPQQSQPNIKTLPSIDSVQRNELPSEFSLQQDDKRQYPPGFNLRHMLKGDKEKIRQIVWSPDGKTVASTDGTIQLWKPKTGRSLQKFEKLTYTVSWSTEGRRLATGNNEGTIRIWDIETWQHLQELKTYSNKILSLVWSPDGRFLASGSGDNITQIWDAETWQLLRTFKKHTEVITGQLSLDKLTQTVAVPSIGWSADGQIIAAGFDDGTIQTWVVGIWEPLWTFTSELEVTYPRLSRCGSIAWSPDKHIVAAGFDDGTIRLIDSQTGRQIGVLEGHTDSISSISFSSDGLLLASKSYDDTMRIWRSDTWETVVDFKESSLRGNTGLVFHPTAPVLASLGAGGTIIRIWDLDLATLLSTPSSILRLFPEQFVKIEGKDSVTNLFLSSIRYTNAKVILVGDSGVGKSGLGLVLTGQQFIPTESTHGRSIWTFESQEVELSNGLTETHETILWDLAGQPSYRLIHQLHMNEVTVALVIFDTHSETDPFAGVHYWNRALQVAQRKESSSYLPMKKFLVAARIDRGGIGVSRPRIDLLLNELGFDGYFETSAKEGVGIEELKIAIHGAINWEKLPWVSSTGLFQRIKSFLISEKEVGRLLSTVDDLYSTFMRLESTFTETKNLRFQFETCIRLIQSRGLIRQLSFGNLILLQPELLDLYASTLINSVKDEPDGLGSISEEKVRKGEFSIPKDERLKETEQEKLLLIAMVEDLLGYEIALREQADDGPYLIFPSQSTRENPNLSNPEGKTVVFSFEGPVLNVYATLAVRLSHSGFFKKKELWKNAVTYIARPRGTCGVFLSKSSEGYNELALFFDKEVSEETRFHFEEYVETHLKRRAIPESIKRHRIIECNVCGVIITDQMVRLRSERGFKSINCPVCNALISLIDREEIVVASRIIQEMDRAADIQREREMAQSILQGKIKTKDYDVFLSYNGEDKAKVKEIGERLKEHGILPWLDEWELRPGLPWQHLLEEQIGQIKSAAVFVGKNGRGPWQDVEVAAFLRQFVKREQKCPVIPVILPDCNDAPDLPIFLEEMTWVDFRRKVPDPMKMLIWGITGERNSIV